MSCARNRNQIRSVEDHLSWHLSHSVNHSWLLKRHTDTINRHHRHRWEWASSKNEEKCCERTAVRERINFDVCEIIQTSDGSSRHLERYYGLIGWSKWLRRVDLFFLNVIRISILYMYRSEHTEQKPYLSKESNPEILPEQTSARLHDLHNLIIVPVYCVVGVGQFLK
jgi:hypothetical protein